MTKINIFRFVSHVQSSTYSQFNSIKSSVCSYNDGPLERTIRQWRTDFLENGEILENKQDRYQRKGLLWSNEKLNEKASLNVRENANVKGAANLTAGSFCFWINECLLPNSCLEPGFPRKISIETAHQWLHHLGFEVLSATKGAYFDGHERDDVVLSRKEFLKELAAVGFLPSRPSSNSNCTTCFSIGCSLIFIRSKRKIGCDIS